MDKRKILSFVFILFMAAGSFSFNTAFSSSSNAHAADYAVGGSDDADYAPFVWENWDPPCIGAYWICATVSAPRD